MNILVKEIDRLTSRKHKGNYTPEYLIYLMMDKTPIECYNVIGDSAKVDRVLELSTKIRSLSTNSSITNIDVNEFVKEISLEEIKPTFYA